MLQKIFRYVFWIGYLAVLIMAFLPLSIRVDKIKLGPEAFQIRTDHLLHFTVYFLICMYYLAGQRKGLFLFSGNSLKKFLLLLLFLAAITELVQLWVPERAFNMFDLVSNVTGVVIGMGVIKMAQRRKPPSLKLQTSSDEADCVRRSRRSKGAKA